MRAVILAVEPGELAQGVEGSGVFVVVGVTGGIAAYKTVHLVRLLVLAGHDVHVMPTDAALRFVGLPTWEAISRNPVTTSVFDDVAEVRHVALGRAADLVVVAPATADFLAKMPPGLADDLLGTTLLATSAPVVVAPAMHTEMWRHPSTTHNIETLRHRGVHVVGPADGPLTGGDSGPGRMREPEVIVERRSRGRRRAATCAAPRRRHRRRHPRADRPGALHRQPLERPPGRRRRRRRRRSRRGRHARRRPRRRGVLAAASVHPRVRSSASEPPPSSPPRCARRHPARRRRRHGRRGRRLPRGRGRRAQAQQGAGGRPQHHARPRRERRHPGGPRRHALRGQTIVGFAAETPTDADELLERGRRKRRRKGVDLLAVNEVGWSKGFEAADNAVIVIDAERRGGRRTRRHEARGRRRAVGRRARRCWTTHEISGNEKVTVQVECSHRVEDDMAPHSKDIPDARLPGIRSRP